MGREREREIERLHYHHQESVYTFKFLSPTSDQLNQNLWSLSRCPRWSGYAVWETALRAVGLCDAYTPELPGAFENIGTWSHPSPGLEGEAVRMKTKLWGVSNISEIILMSNTMHRTMPGHWSLLEIPQKLIRVSTPPQGCCKDVKCEYIEGICTVT